MSERRGDSRGKVSAEGARLLSAWFNGVATEADADRLNELLDSDASVRRAYLEYATAEAELRSVFAGPCQPSVLAEETKAATLSLREGSLRESSTNAARIGSAWGVAPVWTGLAAAGLLAAALIGWAAWGPDGVDRATLVAAIDETAEVEQAPSAEEAPIVAEITGTRDCRWGASSQGVGYGAKLRAQQVVDLEDGIAEITFESGARVVLEGPAELRLTDAGSKGVLFSGRVATTLPPGSAGSPIRTRRMDVSPTRPVGGRLAGVSQFGLSVDTVGGEEVHVFRGSVDASVVGGAARRLRVVHINAQEAACLRPASTTVAKFHAETDKFVRSIATTGGPQDGLYAYEGFDYPSGPLSGKNGGFGWAGAWADIEAACPPGEVASNVVERGNLAVEQLRAIGGRSVQRAQQNRIRRALSTSLGGVFDEAGLVENQDGQRLVGANGTAIYLSFCQRVSHPGDGFYGFELHRGDGNSNRVLCIGNGVDGSGYGATSNYNGYGAGNLAELGPEPGEPSLFVVKIEFGQRNTDVLTVYRDPESLLDDRENTVDARLRGNFAFDRISFGNFDGQKRHEVDELRVGTAYRAVTGRRDRGDARRAPSLADRPSGAIPLAANFSRQLIRDPQLVLAGWNGALRDGAAWGDAVADPVRFKN